MNTHDFSSLSSNQLPTLLRHIPAAPTRLYARGAELATYKSLIHLSVVGSRRLTPYGKSVMQLLLPPIIRAGVVIVSGLALGTDAYAHTLALEHNGRTIAVLPSSVREVYPATNRQLADRIVSHSGTLVSEYPPHTEPLRHHFIERNRIVSGLSHATLIIEAAEKSGTLHTANFALEQGRDVLAVPGNITNANSIGTNNLIKTGAIPVTCADDILRVLGVAGEAKQQDMFAETTEELALIKLLQQGVSEGAVLLAQSRLDERTYNQTLTMLEMKGAITSLGADHWTLS